MNAPSVLPAATNAASMTTRRRSAWRPVAIGLAVAFFVAALSFLLVRDVLLPRADQYRGHLAALIGDAVGLPVSIDALSADVSGLRPRLHLSGVELRDREGRPALRLDTVDATLAWWSLLRGQPHFHRLVLHAPQLALRRDAGGQLFVAGIPVASGGPSGGLSDWLFGQREIVIRDAAVSWHDARRAAPELRLEQVNFRLAHAGGRYRFGLQAAPPAALASTLDLRGDITSAQPAEPGTWSGELYLALAQADLGGWRAWIDYPIELAGNGGMRAWLELTHGQPEAFTANFAADEIATRLAADLPELQLASARGRLSGRRSPAGLSLSARALQLVTSDGLHVEPVDLDFTLREAIDGKPDGGQFSANRLDFGVLARLAAHLPFDEAVRARLAAADPQGRLEALQLAWRGEVVQPDSWSLKTRFHDIGLRPQGVLPGLAGLSGEIEGDEQRGRFGLVGQDMALDLPAVFPGSRLAFSVLHADGGWMRKDGQLEIALDRANFDNADAAGSASGWYRPAAEGRGEIDLAAHLTRAESKAVWRYLPKVVNDATRDWLRRALSGGTVPEARLRLRGKLDDFPFRDGASGQFLVTTRVAGASLDYAEGWPAITDIHGEVRFDGPGMRIVAERARIFGATLGRVVAEVPELDAPAGEVMTIDGRAGGPTAEFLRFVSASPVSGRIDGFTDGMRAEGRGTLDLKLVMPLRDIADSTVKGEFRFADNRLWLVDALPPVTEAGGRVRFTEKDLAIPEAHGRLFGEPMQLVADAAKDGGVSFTATGAASIQALRQAHDWPVLAHLSGTLPWQASIDLRAQQTRVVVQSDLSGVASSLPAPMNKSATVRWPLHVALAFPGGAREDIRVVLDGRAELELMRRRSEQGWEIERGGLALFAPLRQADRGVMVVAELDELDVDAWRAVFDSEDAADEPAGVGADAQMPPLAGIELQVKRATAFGQNLSGVRIAAQTDAGGWKGRIASTEVEGEFDWRERGEGALEARLKRLVVGAVNEGEGGADPLEAYEPPRRLPGLNVVAERFVLRGIDLGRLELQARNRGDVWHLDALAIANADATLRGRGEWRPGARASTTLDFRLEANDIGRFATRMGYEEAVRGGQAVLSGKLGWSGAPTRIHYPSLSGGMLVEAGNGQFRKLEPGMGRLLGVLSLQALPRRLTLDFRDVLSEGFAFDRISGSIDVSAGVMRTDDLLIRGPAARILMSGSADVERETQDLKVTVQPTLSESVAIGTAAGLINPVAGVVAYVAQKALSDPIEKLFAFNYAITGSWADPKVEKLAGRSATANPQPDQE
ncbi:probable transmembrane protein [Aromatoleum aromaticum EbN1]|uniref:Probable transmembrane protein n=1 Tax=Aromatoleum aromaticum (strain DSM 19018 / LMG 30748 / EbN1) TaxID=76114 RepID=Q5P7S2_AROAE|nr:YhdP family protein [Aromatoleum aromaticum]CAI06639.1 probable transmembrane protein [Aromatoleum aromaticum EbN1]